MSSNAIGLLETKGFIAAVAGTDAMVKAANIVVKGMEKIGSAYVTVKISGDVASVKAAIETGAEAASQFGEVISVHVIASPNPQTLSALESTNSTGL
jgi:ethanolamine utilization protein EutM